MPGPVKEEYAAPTGRKEAGVQVADVGVGHFQLNGHIGNGVVVAYRDVVGNTRGTYLADGGGEVGRIGLTVDVAGSEVERTGKAAGSAGIAGPYPPEVPGEAQVGVGGLVGRGRRSTRF